MKIEILNKSKHQLTDYSTTISAGMDLRAKLESELILVPMQRVMVPADLFHEMPVGYKAQIRPRRGLIIKKRITVLNSLGKINVDFSGQVGIILMNLSGEDFVTKDEEIICNIEIAKQEKGEWINMDFRLNTERGEGGFRQTEKN